MLNSQEGQSIVNRLEGICRLTFGFDYLVDKGSVELEIEPLFIYLFAQLFSAFEGLIKANLVRASQIHS
ncbi:MAG: hypothetical protein A2037_10545 [Curvibacter sp. GWA2_63_95]|nr:MAG: hypothetical protein A2037_10545 [Curvibacter sp. GWA2_63_95]